MRELRGETASELLQDYFGLWRKEFFEEYVNAVLEEVGKILERCPKRTPGTYAPIKFVRYMPRPEQK